MILIVFIHILALWFSLFVGGVLIGAIFHKPLRDAVKKVFTQIRRDTWLAKVSHNPILSPGLHPWTAEAVMNPAALALFGRTHLLYRAIGMDGVSRLGYASSVNNVVFDDRLSYPVYASVNPRAGRAGARR